MSNIAPVNQALRLIEARQIDCTPVALGCLIIYNNDRIPINNNGFSMFVPDG